MTGLTSAVWPLQSQCPAVYGANMVHVQGAPGPDPNWERVNLVQVALPWAAHAAWDRTLAVHGLRVHHKVADSLTRVLAALWARAGHDQAVIDAAGLSAIGGGYCWRAMRGGAALSMHSYGAAVDFDPDRNGFGDTTPNFALPGNHWIVDAFDAEGWVWGGRWGKPDGMHFQAARVG